MCVSVKARGKKYKSLKPRNQMKLNSKLKDKNVTKSKYQMEFLPR